jgi:hypothetical protein
MAEQYQIDGVIDKCLEVRGARPGKLVKLEEKEIVWLCAQAKELFLVQPNLLELEAPIKIVGDIHGNAAVFIFVDTSRDHMLLLQASIMISCGCLSMVASPLIQIISSSGKACQLYCTVADILLRFAATTSTVASRVWSASSSSFLIKSNIQQISSCCVATTSAPVLTVSMASMMNVSDTDCCMM